MLGFLRGLVRGAVAWFVGFGLTFIAGALGLYGTGSGLTRTVTASLRAHAVPPTVDAELLVVVVAVAVGGARAGRRTRSGVTGRIRAAVESLGAPMTPPPVSPPSLGVQRGGLRCRRSGCRANVRPQTITALVGGLVYGLLVGVPTAVVASRY
jgi:hypothetical protein